MAWLAIIVAGMVVSACGTGSSDETTASVQGNWSGSYTASGSADSVPVFALIQQSGSAYLFDSTGVVYALPAFTGSPKASGTATAYPAKGYTFADGSTSKSLAMQADTSSGQMDMGFDGDSDDPPGSIQPSQAKLFQLETASGTPSAAAGQWMGFYLSPTPTALALTVGADGTFTGNDAYGCQLRGTLTQLAAEASLFTLSIQSSGPSPACGGTLTGLVHESAYDSFGLFHGAPGTYYYVCASDSHGAFVAELKVQ